MLTSLTDSPQFLRVKSGWLVGRGSGTVTSNPAPAICPVDRASYRSSWFTTPPLTQQKDQNYKQTQEKHRYCTTVYNVLKWFNVCLNSVGLRSFNHCHGYWCPNQYSNASLFVFFTSKLVEEIERRSWSSDTNEAGVLTTVIDLLQVIKLSVWRGKWKAETKCEPLSTSGNCCELLFFASRDVWVSLLENRAVQAGVAKGDKALSKRHL